jgi:hypothetical protein
MPISQEPILPEESTHAFTVQQPPSTEAVFVPPAVPQSKVPIFPPNAPVAAITITPAQAAARIKASVQLNDAVVALQAEYKAVQDIQTSQPVIHMNEKGEAISATFTTPNIQKIGVLMSGVVEAAKRLSET